MRVSENAASFEYQLGFGINRLLQYLCSPTANRLQAACSPLSADRQTGYRQQLKTLNNKDSPFPSSIPNFKG